MQTTKTAYLANDTHSFIRWSLTLRLGMAACLLVLLQGCAVKLIANYDEQTDQALMGLQRSFSEFFLTLEETAGTPAGSVDEYREFYRQTKVNIAAIKLRVDAQPQNDLSSRAVSKLIENVTLLEQVHEEGINDAAIVAVIQDDFNTALVNILRLELAKQRGDF